jgi:hypothetical protein
VTTVIVASQQLVEIILNVASSVDTRLLRDHEQATGFDPKPVVRCDRPRWQAMPEAVEKRICRGRLADLRNQIAAGSPS